MATASSEHSDGRLRALSETMRAFAAATSDYDRLLEIVPERLAHLIGDGCALLLLSDDHKSLSVASVHFRDPQVTGAARTVLGGRVFPCDSSVLGARVVMTRRGLLLPRIDLAMLAREVSPETVDIIDTMGIRSLLSVPLELGDRVLGVAYLMRVDAEVVPFDEDDEAVARTLAEHAALAIANAQLLKSLQRELEERVRAQRETSRLEAQLKQAQKMEAIGTLAGGIAHDFNNILGAILGNVELANLALGPQHPIQVELDEIAQAGRRATRLIRQILAFSRRRESVKRVVSLADLVQEVTGLLRCTISANVELVISVGDGTPNILADATQVHQILLNLCTNAWQALEGAAGRIEVGLAGLMLDARGPANSALAPGRYARLTVTDNGKGMDPVTMERIFDPFFTTKAPGIGTGLGLSVVHGIVKDHGGSIAVTSSPGRGTTFEILFPEQVAAVEEPETESRELPHGHGEHLLFLDDEEALVRLTKRLLERLGYRVSGYVRADEALEAIRDAPTTFDLAITDFNMPGLSGLQVAKLAAMIRPELPVILASGNISDELRASAAQAGIRHVLQKPSSTAELATALQRVLHS